MVSILLHAREAGIAQTFKSLIPTLEDAGFDIFYDISHTASEVLGINQKDSFENIDLFLCGHDTIEINETGKFLNDIKAHKKPSVSILDSWRGADRFWNTENQLREMSDYLFVPDQGTFEYLTNKGLDKAKVFITGQPSIEEFSQMNTSTTEGSNNLLVISETLVKNSENVSLITQKTDEDQSLVDYINQEYKSYQIFTRLHPVEDVAIPNGWTDLSGETLEKSLEKVDLVLGLASTAVAYTASSGKKVINLNRQIKDWTPEQSSIPKPLWDFLETNGVFDSSNNEGQTLYKDSKKRFLSRIKNILNK